MHTAASVLRPSTAKVQPRYRGKYPQRLRMMSISKGQTHITSNDHMVLEVSGDEHRALVVALNHQLPKMTDDIQTLAQHVADYRNAQPEAGQDYANKATGRVVHVTCVKGDSVRFHNADDPTYSFTESAHYFRNDFNRMEGRAND